MHVHETIRMLFLAIAQIEIALGESDEAVEHLTSSFTTMVEQENEISNSAQALTETKGQHELYGKIQRSASVISDKTQESIIAFQFYDKLTQRLAHVSQAMEELGDLLDDRNKIDSSEAWLALQTAIKSKYSMREEHELFEAVVYQGEDIRQAIRRYHDILKNRKTASPADGEIEFF